MPIGVGNTNMSGVEFIINALNQNLGRREAYRKSVVSEQQNAEQLAQQKEHQKALEKQANDALNAQIESQKAQQEYNNKQLKIHQGTFVQSLVSEMLKTGQNPAGVTENPGQVISPARQELNPNVPIPQVGSVVNVPEQRGPSEFTHPALDGMKFSLPNIGAVQERQMAEKKQIADIEAQKQKEIREAQGAEDRKGIQLRVDADKEVQGLRNTILKEEGIANRASNESIASMRGRYQLAAAEARAAERALTKKLGKDLPTRIQDEARGVYTGLRAAEKLDKLLAEKDTNGKTVAENVFSTGVLDAWTTKNVQELKRKAGGNMSPKVTQALILIGRTTAPEVKAIYGAKVDNNEEAMRKQFLLIGGIGSENVGSGKEKIKAIKELLYERRHALETLNDHNPTQQEQLRALRKEHYEKDDPDEKAPMKVTEDDKGNVFIKR